MIHFQNRFNHGDEPWPFRYFPAWSYIFMELEFVSCRVSKMTWPFIWLLNELCQIIWHGYRMVDWYIYWFPLDCFPHRIKSGWDEGAKESEADIQKPSRCVLIPGQKWPFQYDFSLWPSALLGSQNHMSPKS